jgi:hypothetical protein
MNITPELTEYIMSINKHDLTMYENTKKEITYRIWSNVK